MNEHTIPTYIIKLPHQDLNYCKIEDVYNYVSIADMELKNTYAVAEKLKDRIIQEREEHNQDIKKIRKEYEELALKLEKEHQKALEQFQKKSEEFEKAIEENKEYKAKYGVLISPILIVKELWNNGTIGELDMLVPPSRWKVGNQLNGESGSKAKRYWLSQFEEWNFLKTWGKGKYMANMGMYEALEILNQMMNKNEIRGKEIKI